jgi:hypothetical protein
VNGYSNRDLFVHVDLLEVNVAHSASNWMTLEFFHDRGVGAAVHRKFKNCVHASWARESNTQITTLNAESNWGHAVSVENTWDATLGAQAARSRRARGAICESCEACLV